MKNTVRHLYVLFQGEEILHLEWTRRQTCVVRGEPHIIPSVRVWMREGLPTLIAKKGKTSKLVILPTSINFILEVGEHFRVLEHHDIHYEYGNPDCQAEDDEGVFICPEVATLQSKRKSPRYFYCEKHRVHLFDDDVQSISDQ